MTTVTITNPTRTRKFGFGYNASPSQGENGYYFEPPTAPDYTGTFASVQRQIDEDRTYRSFRSGGTLMSTAWFYDGKRITDKERFMWQMNDIYGDREHAQEYRQPTPPTPAITVEVED